MSTIPNEVTSARRSNDLGVNVETTDGPISPQFIVNTYLQNESRMETGIHEQKPVSAGDFMSLINMIKQNQQQSHLFTQPFISSQIQCNCLEKLRLQVSQELDLLRGAFRKKESELIAPIINRYANMEQKIEILSESISRIEAKTNIQETNMLVQERTVGIIIDILSKLQNQAEYASQAFNYLSAKHDPHEDLIKLKQSWNERVDTKPASPEKQSHEPLNMILECSPVELPNNPLNEILVMQTEQKQPVIENEDEEKTEMRYIDFTQGTTSAPSSVSETSILYGSKRHIQSNQKLSQSDLIDLNKSPLQTH